MTNAWGKFTALLLLIGICSDLTPAAQATPFCMADYGIQAILADFKPHAQRIYLGTGEAGLVYSPDGGRSWSVRGPRGVSVNQMLRQGPSLLLASDDGLIESRNEGKSWRHLGLKGYSVLSLASVIGQNALWVGTPAGLFRYDFGRQAWDKPRRIGWYTALLSTPSLPGLAGWEDGPPLSYDPMHDSWDVLPEAPVWTRQIKVLQATNHGLLAANGQSVFRRSETGQWQTALKGLPQGSLHVRNFAGAGDKVLALLDEQGVYRSDNGGLSWRNWSQGLEKVQLLLQGLTRENGGERIYAGSFHQGLYVRMLSGSSWQRLDRPCRQN